MSFEDITKHPCFRNGGRISHRSGGYGGTCERCGTALNNGNANDGEAGPLKWEPVAEPKPFQPGSIERMIYDVFTDSGAPIHYGWRESLTISIAGKLQEHVAKVMQGKVDA